MTMKKGLYLILILTLPISLMAQSSDLGNWIIYFGNKKINNQWNWHHEVQYRNYDAIGDLEQLLLRTELDTTLRKTTTIYFLAMALFTAKTTSTSMIK